MESTEDNVSLLGVVNVSSSDSESEEQLPPLKKNKITKSEQAKKAPKQRMRRVTCRLTKTPSKRYGKNSESYENYTCSVADERKLDDLSKSCFECSSVKNILELYDLIYEIKSGIKIKENCIFVQDKYMIKYFNYFPECICIDMLCELIELKLNLYLFISVDSNGVCEVVALGLLRSYEAAFSWLCEAFKKHNLNWKKIKLIISDNFVRNNEAIKNAFPEKPVFISFFHSMKSLKKDLFSTDFKVTDENLNQIFIIYEKMVFTPDECEYSELLKKLKTLSPPISSYFRKVWNQKRESWSLSSLDAKLLLKSINVYLNLIRKYIRPFICSHNSIESVLKNCFSIIQSMRVEKFQEFITVLQKQSSNEKKATVLKYSNLLTPFATKLIIEQLSNSKYHTNITKISSENFLISASFFTNKNSCTCNFHSLLFLPCAHIFSLRKALHMCLYDELLCSSGWFISSYKKKFIDLLITCSGVQKQYLEGEKLFDFRNYELYFEFCEVVWPLLFECPENVSRERISIFKRLLECWDENIKIKLCPSSYQQVISSSCNIYQDVSRDYWKDTYGITLSEILDSDDDVLPTIS